MAKQIKKKKGQPNFPEPESSENKENQKKTNPITWIVFLFSISVVLISLISVIFPALIVSNNSVLNELEELGIALVVDPFVTGVWIIPLLLSNIAVFAILFSYHAKKLPKSVMKSIDFVFTFEVSKKITLIIILLILAIYIGASVGDLGTEEEWEDYAGVKKTLERWSPDKITPSLEPNVRYFLLSSSMIMFGNYTIIPFIASISLLLLTYFFTVEISKKRFAGIIAIIILVQSNVFLTYDSTVSYTNFWILFYLLSLYLVYKVWPLSPLSYVLSILSKSLTVMFLPMSLFFIYRTDISMKKKIIISASIVSLMLVGLAVAIAVDNNFTSGTGSQEEFDSDDFWLGFTSFSYQLRFDGLVILFILPLIVGLFIASRNGIKDSDSIMILIAGILFTAPLLTGFTDQTNQPYRFVPLVVFFAIGVGVLLSKRKF